MTYYQSQVLSLSTALYSNTYLTRQVIQARHFIDTNFTKDITLDDICDHACISKFHLLRSFKKIYGRTPYQYMTSVRVGKAKELLKANTSVKETSFLVGFESPTSFAKFFKKLAGTSPIAFQMRSA